jgi:predicted ATPase/class 3 adenylate cyclase
MVTFAFTDIEGSTVRWERYPAAMQEALRCHDAIVRAAIARHGGHVFTTTGDAFCCAFWSAGDAVAAMLDAQHALAAEDFAAIDGLRVRAAIHTGTADERDADYFGPAVNRVARLLAIAHGGQVLLSGAARIALGNALPGGAALRDLGEHRLKDLARSEHVFQLLAPGLAAQFPPLRSLDARHNNLPLQLTSFVGRDDEVASITALLAAHRLVTIVGAGGVGKTRTSLHAGAQLLDGSGDGVWFIELAPLANGEYLPTTVAQAMGIALRGDRDPLGELVGALHAKRALLIFDNCEHLTAPAARAVAAILHGCPEIRILTTSRQSLGVSGEMVYRMPSLALPAADERLAAANAVRYPVLALFEERAAAVDGRFRLTDDNVSVVGDICRRLDGIPLAIELAAARIKILSPRQLRERLDERFRLLTGGKRDLLPRQQTLRALIDWSYDLLDDFERTVFRRLGTFVSGFTLEGAVALAGAAEFDEVAVIDALGSLVDQSLVMAEPDGDTLRYRMLESTQAYARERLDASGERAGCAASHLAFFGRLFGDAMSRATQTGSATEIESLLIAELDNVRAALESAARTSPEAGADLLAAIDSRWHWVTLGTEGAAHLQRFIALLPRSEPCRAARLWTALARIARDTRPVLALGWRASPTTLRCAPTRSSRSAIN